MVSGLPGVGTYSMGKAAWALYPYDATLQSTAQLRLYLHECRVTSNRYSTITTQHTFSSSVVQRGMVGIILSRQYK